MTTFEQIKSVAENRSTEILKEDIKVAFKNKEYKNTDATKIVYHAIAEILLERLGEAEFEKLEAEF